MDDHDGPRPQRRRGDGGMIVWFERTLTKTGKVVTAVGALLAALLAGGTTIYHLDGRYVHTDAYAGDLRHTATRFDQSDLRTLEGNLTVVQGQIFTLERQSSLTHAELQFLTELKGRQGKITRDIDDLRRKIRADEQATKP